MEPESSDNAGDLCRALGADGAEDLGADGAAEDLGNLTFRGGLGKLGSD